MRRPATVGMTGLLGVGCGNADYFGDALIGDADDFPPLQTRQG